MKKKVKTEIPDLTEFTDASGRKWVQTSTEDLLAMHELSDILGKIDRERDDEGVVLARIDFQKVDREFYNAAVELQKKLVAQSDLMKKYADESARLLEKKNKKLKELIEYIKKLHLLLAHLNSNPEEAEKFDFSDLSLGMGEAKPEVVSVYEEVEEVVYVPGEGDI